MKRADYSSISGTLGQRFKSGTLEFLQTAPKEVIQVLMKAIYGISPTDTILHVLYGCTNFPTGGFNVISAGAIYYNGEVYLVPASTTIPDPPVTGLIATLVVSPTLDSRHDPVSFTDGSTANVHLDRTIRFADGSAITSGYIADFANLHYLGYKNYTPTLSANDGAVDVPGAFTGTAVGTYKLVNDTLFIRMIVTAADTINTAKFLAFTLPADITLPTAHRAEGFSLCKYFDGAVYTTKQVKINLTSGGSGTALEVSNFDEGFFGTASGGTIDFSIVISIRDLHI